MKEWLNRLPSISRNFYVVTGVLFLVWMAFFDSNDFITQFKNYAKLSELEEEKSYYQQKTVEVQEEGEALFGNQRQLEKFARENYLMKKKTEDVYIIQVQE